MYPEGWRTRLEDILEAIQNVQSYVRGMTFDEFASDMKTIKAAAFEIAVVGEAASHVPEDLQTRFPDIPWNKMVGMRNVVIHEYFRVDVQILWQTIVENLPPLVPRLQDILGKAPIGETSV